MVAELVAAVQDPAGHVGVLVEPGADRQYGDPRSRALRLGEDRAPGRGVAVAVEGERDAGAVPGAVRDLHGLVGEPARAGGGGRRGGSGRGGGGGGGRLGRRRGPTGGGDGTGGDRGTGEEGGSTVRVAVHPPI